MERVCATALTADVWPGARHADSDSAVDGLAFASVSDAELDQRQSVAISNDPDRRFFSVDGGGESLEVQREYSDRVACVLQYFKRDVKCADGRLAAPGTRDDDLYVCGAELWSGARGEWDLDM